MQRKKIIISVLFILGLAILSIGLWLASVLRSYGWDQFNWLWGEQSAVFGIIAMVVTAYLLPIGLLKKISWRQLWLPGLELYFVGIIAFFLTKSMLYSLFLPFPVFELSPYLLYLMLGVLMLTSAGSFFYLTRNHFYPLKTAFIPLMVGTEILAAALSLLTGYLIFREPGIGELLMRSVQVGLPFFFITLLLGLFSIFSIRKLSLQQIEEEEQEEILDDLMM